MATNNTSANENVTQALINVQSKLKPLQKNVTGHHGKYANLEAVMNVLQPLLDQEKLAVIPLPDTGSSGSCSIKTILRHAPSGEEIVSTITVPMQRQNDPQAFGAAMTYARRYALLCMFNMVTEDDDAQATSYSLERLLRELSKANDLDELQNIKAGHIEGKFLTDKFWATVYRVMYEKKYNGLLDINQKKD